MKRPEGRAPDGAHSAATAMDTGVNPWLSGFAWLTAAATFVLICVGGLVTSHGAGLAVPDWPNSYGYNMFFFPISYWVGGIFYEHTHRLLGSLVGFLTVVLLLWLYGRKSRTFLIWAGAVFLALGLMVCFAAPLHWETGKSQITLTADVGVSMMILGAVGVVGGRYWPRSEPQAAWLRRLGVIALVAVIFQGVLGGLRVTALKDELGIFHGALAQMFFVLMVCIALFTTRWWRQLGCGVAPGVPSDVESGHLDAGIPGLETGGLQRLYMIGVALVFLQLVLGATMRHQHAGLAIPDFPLAYGAFYPATDPDSVAVYNQSRMEVAAHHPIQPFHIHLQMAHRFGALLILAAIGAGFWRTARRLGWSSPLTRLNAAWGVLVVAQTGLGALTIWTEKSADIATAHVAVGALTLVIGSVLVLVARRLSQHSRAGGTPAAIGEAASLAPGRSPGGRDACATLGLVENPRL